MSFIEFQHVKKIYGSKNEVEIRALDDASFSVEKGELAVILGASGAGKTTALNILGGMDSATEGEAVSYTRLDVYKRQHRSMASTKAHPLDSLYITATIQGRSIKSASKFKIHPMM